MSVQDDILRQLLDRLVVDGFEGAGGPDPVWILRLPVTDDTRSETILSMKLRVTDALAAAEGGR